MSFLTLNGRTLKTFRAKNGAGTKHSTALRNYARATLGSDALREAVKLPPGEDLQEWVAVHVVDFFNQINMLYSTITKLCSPSSCPKMMATEEYEYLWQDTQSSHYRKPTRLSAPEYVENLMQWVQRYLDNPDYFPSALGVEFTSDAMQVFKTILRRLFRVYAHIYCHHFEQISELGLEPHLNTSLKHFVLFSEEFDLVDTTEFGPLAELIDMLKKE